MGFQTRKGGQDIHDLHYLRGMKKASPSGRYITRFALDLIFIFLLEPFDMGTSVPEVRYSIPDRGWLESTVLMESIALYAEEASILRLWKIYLQTIFIFE